MEINYFCPKYYNPREKAFFNLHYVYLKYVHVQLSTTGSGDENNAI